MSNLELITTEQVLELLDISRATFERMRRQHGFPHPYSLTSKCYRYSLSEIKKWLIERKDLSRDQKREATIIKHIPKSSKTQKKPNDNLSLETWDMLYGGQDHEAARSI